MRSSEFRSASDNILRYGMDENDELERLRNLPITSEIRFASDELVSCGKCGRANSPERSACIYCGAVINDLAEEQQPALPLRELESWEKGYNVVITAAASTEPERASFEAAARALGLDPEILSALLAAGGAFPVARLDTEENASTVRDRLVAIGFAPLVISDESLAPADPPQRLRSIDLADDSVTLHLFGSDLPLTLALTDVALIVRGFLTEEQVHSKSQRRRGTTKMLTEATTVGEEPAVDVYSHDDPIGWRIPWTGFDFSCLGQAKSLTVAANMELLVARLAESCPAAKVIDDYVRVRPLLEHVWPSETRKDSRAFQRSGFRLKDLASVSITSNTTQLVKYSRLQWHLL